MLADDSFNPKNVIDTQLYGYEILGKGKLKEIAWLELGMEIQDDSKPHTSLEDAIATMRIFKKHK